MRRWWRAAAAAADEVSARPALWLPGALAWTITVGWLPLVVAVARPPSVADLTFLGANLYTSGAWPWNAVVAGLGLLAVLTAAVVFVALAEAILVGGPQRPPSVADVARVVGIAVVTAMPALAALLAVGTGFVLVALDEFTSPGAGDPLLRSLAVIAPFLVLVAAAWGAGAVVHAAAVRLVVLRGAGIPDALAAAPGRLWRAGPPVVVGAAVGLVARVVYLGFVGLLLSVLWASLADRLVAGRIDAVLVPLLVGFVAIWLCLVLAGGALHAWGSLTWSRVLGGRLADRGGAAEQPRGDPHRS